MTTRYRRLQFLAVWMTVACWALVAAHGAFAASDATATAVSCTPSSPATASATTCTVTVTDTAASGATAPGAAVSLSSAPDTGTFSSGGTCTLTAASGSTATCALTFTPAGGGAYTILAQYGGDGGHTSSAGTTPVSAVDPTVTAITCTPATVVVGNAASCVATVTDTTTLPGTNIGGSVGFSVAPASPGSFGTPGTCVSTPTSTGVLATCPVAFTPPAAGGYTITATYNPGSGATLADAYHATSTGSVQVTANATPAPPPSAANPVDAPPIVSGPGATGTTGATGSVGATAALEGTVTIGAKAAVSKRGAAAVSLSCAGVAGGGCAGKLALTVTRKVKVAARSKATRTAKPKLRTEIETLTLGHASYSLISTHKKRLSVKLSSKGRKLLAAAKGHRLKVTAVATISGATVASRTVALSPGKSKGTKKRHARKPRHKV